MNKYITALLIVLATTGVEAQTYQSALKAALGDVSIEDLYHHQDYKDLKSNLLSVLKTLNEMSDEEKTEPSHYNKFVFRSLDFPVLPYFSSHLSIINTSKEDAIASFVGTSIVIRGPNLALAA